MLDQLSECQVIGYHTRRSIEWSFIGLGMFLFGFGFGFLHGKELEHAKRSEDEVGLLFWADSSNPAWDEHSWDRVRVGDPDHFLLRGGDIWVSDLQDGNPLATEAYSTTAGHVILHRGRRITEDERRALEIATLRSNGCPMFRGLQGT